MQMICRYMITCIFCISIYIYIYIYIISKFLYWGHRKVAHNVSCDQHVTIHLFFVSIECNVVAKFDLMFDGSCYGMFVHAQNILGTRQQPLK